MASIAEPVRASAAVWIVGKPLAALDFWRDLISAGRSDDNSKMVAGGHRIQQDVETGAVRMGRFFETSQQNQSVRADLPKFATVSRFFEMPQALTARTTAQYGHRFAKGAADVGMPLATRSAVSW